MSACISGQGEASEHTPQPDDEFTCMFCGEVDVDGMRTALRDSRQDRRESNMEWAQQSLIIARAWLLLSDKPNDDGPWIAPSALTKALTGVKP